MRPPDKNAYEKEINRLQGGSDIFSLQAVVYLLFMVFSLYSLSFRISLRN